MSYKNPRTVEAPTLTDVKEHKRVKLSAKPAKLTEVEYDKDKGLETLTEEEDYSEEDEAD